MAQADDSSDDAAARSARMWESLLDAVASGACRVHVETPSGLCLVVVAETEFARLQHRADLNPSREGAVALTPREVEVLKAAAAGSTAAEVAQRLGLSISTVSQHLATARSKFGVRTTGDAAQAAARAGLL